MPRKIEPRLMEIGARVGSTRGRHFWRSLDELADTAEFRRFLEAEFPFAMEPGGIDRRTLLKVMGASLALAGLAGCDGTPAGTVAAGADHPLPDRPGEPLVFATALPLDGYGRGALVRTVGGRPIKIDGNPAHPASLGGSDVYMQAELLTFYDPDRSGTVREAGGRSSWQAFAAAWAAERDRLAGSGGAGLRILTGTVTSPTLAVELERLRADYPEAVWHQYQPVNEDNTLAGTAAAFGEPLTVRHRIAEAAVILALDADFLAPGPSQLADAAGFAAARRILAPAAEPVRLYAVQSSPTLTGARADHLAVMPPSAVAPFARAVAAGLGLAPGGEGAHPLLATLLDDLRNAGPRALVVAGRHQPPAVHAAAHAINLHLGAVGTTVEYTDAAAFSPADQIASLRTLADDMAAGEVTHLVMLGGNPAYDAPVDLAFAERLAQVSFAAHLALHENETSALCRWHLPEAHALETWGDLRALDGTATVQQPVTMPLRDGRSGAELLALLRGDPRPGQELVRGFWEGWHRGGGFDAFWQRALHDGAVPGTDLAPRRVRLRQGWDTGPSGPPPGDGLEVLFLPDATVRDGRYANNAWLQELPKPLSLLTWDNALLLAPATAALLGVANEDVVEVALGERKLEAPVWIMPGHAPGCVTLPLGYGRRRAGRVGDLLGFDAYALRTASAPWIGAGARLRPTGRRHRLASTQIHHTMAGRDLVRTASLAEFRADPDFARLAGPMPSIYPEYGYGEGHAWGMAIDLNACIGCNACVVACQAENNVPVVGKEQIAIGREMHWLRVDRYYGGDPALPETYFQPLPCMHCEKAPCELVCPVNATVHSSEGLNDMVYNRCIGTRTCSNNCPYKVRRFNWFDYSAEAPNRPRAAANPEVSIRRRGVMEKCTYCVQRISGARIAAKLENRRIRDGEVVTACQQACPTQAIVFGDLNDPDSAVNRLKASPLEYALLGELNTQPRTTYLARIANPVPGRRQGG